MIASVNSTFNFLKGRVLNRHDDLFKIINLRQRKTKKLNDYCIG